MLNSIPTEIRTILKRFACRIAVSEILEISAHSGFSGASVWQIVTQDRRWAFRRWPAGALPEVRLRGLHRLLQHLQQCGLGCIAVPVADDTGDTLPAHDQHLWQLEPWLPGTADFHAHPRPERLTAVMQALAEWHRAAATFVPADQIRPWFASLSAGHSPTLSERLQVWRTEAGRILTHGQPMISAGLTGELKVQCQELIPLITQLGPKIADELSHAQSLTIPLQPCLRDIWHDHVLFTGDAVSGLIDASACRTESVAADLSRLLGSLIEDDRIAWHTALETYRRCRPLSLAEETLIGVLDRSGTVLSGLTWLRWLCVEQRTFSDAKSVQQRLEFLIRRLRRLASFDETAKLMIRS